jgi:ABC-type nitrate/sulfonate/bicarbonate transport system substrate-binding protein
MIAVDWRALLRGRRLGCAQAARHVSCALLLAASLTLVTAASAEPAPLRLAGVTYLGDLPTLVAHEDDLFARHGLNIEVTRLHSGKENLERLRAGDIDFALMALTPFVLDRLARPSTGAGDDPVILANLVHAGRLNHIIVLSSSGIREPADLAGKRLGLLRGTNAEFLWWQFSAYHGIDADRVDLIDLPVADIGPALRAGDIDAAALWEPWTTQLAETEGNNLLRLPGSGIYIAHWVLVAKRDLARGRPDTVRRVLAAYQDATRTIEREPARTLRLHADAAGVASAGLFSERDTALFGLSLNWALLAALRQQIEWARTAGPSSHDAPTDVLSWIERGPLEALDRSAVGIPRPVPVEPAP